MARKRYPDYDDEIDPFMDVESEDIEVGPTDDLPYRFTEQALNPRATATTGQAQRDPRARSAFTGATAQREAGFGGDILYKKQLPMRAVSIARGSIDKYQGLAGFSDISDPNSLRGREAIANLGGFSGDTQKTNIMDMPQIGKQLGLNETQMDQAMNQTFEDTYTRMGDRENEKGRVLRGKGDAIGEAMTEAEMKEMRDANPNFSFKQGRRLTSDQSSLLDKDGNMLDEVKFFRGLARLSDSGEGTTGKQKNLEFDLGSDREIQQLMKLGGKNDFSTGKNALMDDQRAIDTKLRKGGKTSKYSKYFEAGIKTAIMASFAAAGGVALGPALGSAMGGSGFAMGAGAGAAGGFTGAMTNQFMEDEFSAKQAGIATGVGFGLGGAAGFAGDAIAANAPKTQQGHLIDSQNMGYNASNISTREPMQVAQEFLQKNRGVGAGGVGGASSSAGTTSKRGVFKPLLKGGSDVFQDVEGQEAQFAAQERASQSRAQKNAKQYGRGRDAFEKQNQGLPDSPFYDPEDDFSGVQEDIF